MANTGRTLDRWKRAYVKGYDLSGIARSVGECSWKFENPQDSALNWEVKGGLCGTAEILTGNINSQLKFDTTPATSEMDWLTGMRETFVNVMIPHGIRAAPQMGDPTWMCQQEVAGAYAQIGQPLTTITVEFAPTAMDNTPTTLNYDIPWGVLLHALGAETGANTSTGFDGGAATSKGAWMMAQITAYSGTGNATISVQDAATNTNPSFAAVTGLTTGAIAHTAMPCAVIAQTGTTATIRQFTRWQLSLVGLTSISFALSVARGR